LNEGRLALEVIPPQARAGEGGTISSEGAVCAVHASGGHQEEQA
jgi:hypothetical protein